MINYTLGTFYIDNVNFFPHPPRVISESLYCVREDVHRPSTTAGLLAIPSTCICAIVCHNGLGTDHVTAIALSGVLNAIVSITRAERRAELLRHVAR